jgi:hypothetical protein
LIPPWVDRRQYPFEPHGLDVEGGRLSYVDEGGGFGLSDRPADWSYRPEDHAPPEERAPESLPFLTRFLER